MSDGYTVTFDFHRANATLVVWYDGNTAELETVSSKYRRRGNAGAVMQKALDYADHLNLEVVLEVQPFGDGIGMRDHELKSWYMTFGFLSEGNNIMARPRLSERLLSEAADHADKHEVSSDRVGTDPRLVRGADGSD